MIAVPSEGLIKRCAEAVSKDLQQRKKLLDDECYGFRDEVLAIARGEFE